jgi:hypothetical protein
MGARVRAARRVWRMVELFCDSFEQVPSRIVLDIDDTEDEDRRVVGLASRLIGWSTRPLCIEPD